MHSRTIDEITFHHNGDYSGDVLINGAEVEIDGYDGSTTITISFEVLAEFVSDAVRVARRSRLEQLEWYEVLGLEDDSEKE